MLSGCPEDVIVIEDVPELPAVGCDLKESLGLLSVAEAVDREEAFALMGKTKKIRKRIRIDRLNFLIPIKSF